MADEAEMLARLETLEIRAAYQEQTIEELNAALSAQWREIDKLRRDMVLLENELREAAAGRAGDPGLPEPPPPHY